MTSRTFSTAIRAVLLDIEGTTTPIDFVYKTLFPYARARIDEYLSANWSQQSVREDLTGLINQNADDVHRGLEPPLLAERADQVSVEAAAAYLRWLMDQDRKVTALKSLQGKIWEEGYRKGELKGEVFDDVPPAFKRWRDEERMICIYSSGSVLAQKLLFANTSAGDLTPLISGYYDTKSGPKKEAESYRRIAKECELKPAELIFVSDVTDELDAAATAGLRTVLCVRPGNHPQDTANQHPVISTFDQVLSSDG